MASSKFTYIDLGRGAPSTVYAFCAGNDVVVMTSYNGMSFGYAAMTLVPNADIIDGVIVSRTPAPEHIAAMEAAYEKQAALLADAQTHNTVLQAALTAANAVNAKLRADLDAHRHVDATRGLSLVPTALSGALSAVNSTDGALSTPPTAPSAPPHPRRTLLQRLRDWSRS